MIAASCEHTSTFPVERSSPALPTSGITIRSLRKRSCTYKAQALMKSDADAET
jgi:hypothetical protein